MSSRDTKEPPSPENSGRRSDRGTARAIERATAQGAWIAVQPAAVFVALLFAALVPLHLLLGPGPSGRILATAAAATAVAAASVGLLWRVRPPDPERSHAWLSLLVFLLIANTSLHLVLGRSVHVFNNYALIAVAAGFLFLSGVWLSGLLLLNGGVAFVLWMQAPPHPDSLHFGSLFLMANAIAVTAHHVRMRGLRRWMRQWVDTLETRRSLQRSEDHLRRAQEVAHVGIYDFDAETGGDAHWSAETFRILGLAPQEPAPAFVTYIDSLVHPDDRSWFRVELMQDGTLASRHQIRHRVIRPDGETRHVEIVGGTVRDSKVGFRALGAILDVSDRVLAEEEVKRYQMELAHASRLCSMGEMAAALAHELKQPLAAIVNFANGCARRLESPEPDLLAIRQKVLEIASQTELCSDIVSSLRSFARKAEPKPRWVGVTRLIEEALRLVEVELRRDEVVKKWGAPGADLEIFADPIEVTQVLVNLIRNATEAMRNAKSPHTLFVSALATDGEEVEFTVEDSGEGLGTDTAAGLFEPFSTSKPEGLGLGLSISRRIVEAHGGRIWFHENDGAGLTFHFTMPGRRKGDSGA